MLDYIEKKKARVLHMGNDQLAEWWIPRSAACIKGVKADGQTISFKTVCDYPSGA